MHSRSVRAVDTQRSNFSDIGDRLRRSDHTPNLASVERREPQIRVSPHPHGAKGQSALRRRHRLDLDQPGLVEDAGDDDRQRRLAPGENL